MPPQDIIVFDGACAHCARFARFMVRHDRTGRFRFATAQSAAGRAIYRAHGLDPDALETSIVILDGAAHVKLGAICAAMGALGWPWRGLAALGAIPRPLGDWCYDRIARNRNAFGRQTCPMPSAALRARLIVDPHDV